MATSNMRALGVSFLLISILFPSVAFAQNEGPFQDIPAHSQFSLPLSFLKTNHFIEGYSDGTFQPERQVTRAEALAMIMKATRTKVVADSGTTTVKVISPSGKKLFQDVSKKDWFYETVRDGKKLGVVRGESDGKYFRPNAPVNLAQALRMLFQSSETATNAPIESKDVPPGIPLNAWYTKDIVYAASHYLLTVQEDGRVFPPDEKLHRGELALLLYRFLQSRSSISFGYASWYGDGLSKIKPAANREYLEKALTAAHLTLPFGSLVRVTNTNNGKQVDVVVNDRGPHVKGRIIDLSKTAFSALANPGIGLISVQLEPLK